MARNGGNSAAVLAGRRAMQVAAARALGRVAVASSVCRSTVIHVTAKDQQLLVRLLPALRCPLTMEELEVKHFCALEKSRFSPIVEVVRSSLMAKYR